jgi:ADP-ribose pyrophosphatase YjhB (NUDIX family)
MNYCSTCGSPVQLGIPPGDDRQRFICSGCHAIHYHNPKMVVGAIVMEKGKLLICKRAIEPRLGTWTLPAGYMENGETIEEAAMREAREEAGAVLIDLQPYALLNLPIVDQLYFIFLARLEAGYFLAGRRALRCKLIDLEDIPWDDLSFPVIRRVLEVFVADYGKNNFPFRILDVPTARSQRAAPPL